MQPALELIQLTKTYDSKQAVANLSLQIHPGEFYALLGPNGAGKTTTLRIVAGLLKPDQGDVQIWGQSITRQPKRAKQFLAYLPDEPLIYNKLNALEYLEFVAGLWGIPRTQALEHAQTLLKQLNLWEVRSDLCETYSRGMKQKLALAGAFIHNPKLIILDEPLTGLDAGSAKLVKDILSAYVQQDNTVVLTTHIMEIAERMAQRIGILNQGKLVAEGTLEELQQKSGDSQSTLETVFLQLTQQYSGNRTS